MHARLLEEHGATVALLKQREAQIVGYDQRETQSRHTVASLEQNLRLAAEKVTRHETRASLAEHEVTFLQALVVSWYYIIYAAADFFQASYNAEEVQTDDIHVDAAKVERIRQLETVLLEYKEANMRLVQEVDALGGGLDPGDRLELSAEVEKERLEKLALQKGVNPLPALPCKITYFFGF